MVKEMVSQIIDIDKHYNKYNFSYNYKPKQKKSGFAKENKIILYLNNQKFKNLNKNMKSMLNFLYDNEIKDSDIIKAKKVKRNSAGKNQKPDLEVCINNKKKYISVKTGNGNSVHQEKIDSFINYLRNNNIEEPVISNLLEYHYADGSIDGTGENRLTISKWKKENSENPLKIRNINESLDSISRDLIDRFLFKGIEENILEVDLIYYGNLNNALWASRCEILNYFMKTNCISTGVKIKHLTYQIWNRNLRQNPNTEKRRESMQIKWPTLKNDLEEITKKRKNKS